MNNVKCQKSLYEIQSFVPTFECVFSGTLIEHRTLTLLHIYSLRILIKLVLKMSVVTACLLFESCQCMYRIMTLSYASYLWWQPYHFSAESEVIFLHPLHLNLIYHFRIMQNNLRPVGQRACTGTGLGILM